MKNCEAFQKDRVTCQFEKLPLKGWLKRIWELKAVKSVPKYNTIRFCSLITRLPHKTAFCVCDKYVINPFPMKIHLLFAKMRVSLPPNDKSQFRIVENKRSSLTLLDILFTLFQTDETSTFPAIKIVRPFFYYPKLASKKTIAIEFCRNAVRSSR